MLYPWLNVGVVGKEGLNFTAVSSLVAAVVIFLWWGSMFLNLGAVPANVPQIGTPSPVPPLLRVIPADDHFGVFSIETPRVEETRAAPLDHSGVQEVQATSTQSWSAVQAATGTAWALEQAHRSDLPACTPTPDDPCMDAWAQAGKLDQYWQLWTPGAGLPPPPTQVWYSTISPDRERELLMTRVAVNSQQRGVPRSERFSEPAAQAPAVGQGIRIP